MFNFGNKETKQVYAALIDISSGSVGVALVATTQSDGLPVILYTHRMNMRITQFNEVQSDNLRRVRETLFSACLVLSQEGYPILREHDQHGKISKLFITCSSPWSNIFSQNVQYENDIRFKISNSIIDDLVKSALAEISNTIKNSTTLSGVNFESIEQISTDFVVNEYPVKTTVGLSGNTIGLTHIVGLIPAEISSSITEVHEKLFKGADCEIHSFIFIAHKIIADIFKNVHTMCIIHIGGESSEFAFVENDVLRESIHENYGVNTFVRDIMLKTQKPQSDILSSMHAYTEGVHTSDAEIENYIHEYTDRIFNTLKATFEHRSIPKEIFIIVNTPHEKIFKNVVASAFEKLCHVKKQIISLDSNITEHIVEGSHDDVPLALSARFFHTYHRIDSIQE